MEKILKEKTPLLIYNIDILEKHLKTLNNEFNFISLFYSMKANRNKSLLSILLKYVKGVDVSSIDEYYLAKEIGFSEISVTIPWIAYEMINKIYLENNVYNFNSENQLYEWIDFRNKKIKKISLRIKLSNLKEKKYVVYGTKSRFGIKINNKLLKYLKNKNIEVFRLHIHFGEKDILNLKIMFHNLDNLIKKIGTISELNIGGGFNNLYYTQKNYFINLLKLFSKKYPHIRIIIEPGCLIIQKCGFLLTEIKEVKDNFILLNSSCFNLFEWITPQIINPKNVLNLTNYSYNIYGISCFEEDVFQKNFKSSKLNIGDKLIIGPTGAYFESFYKNLNNIPFPNIKFLKKGELL